MFIGHFGVGFAAKYLAPRASLGTLLLSSHFIDLLWSAFLLLSVERVRIEPGATAVTPLVFEYYPASHSLVAVLGWAFLVGGIYFLIRKERCGAAVVSLLVLSHWVLDFIVHQPDLPILPGSSAFFGLGLWSSLPLTALVELALFAFGVSIYVRCTTPTKAIGERALTGLVALLLLIYIGNLFGEVPPSVNAIAWMGQLQWLLIACGYWIDTQRRCTLAPGNAP